MTNYHCIVLYNLITFFTLLFLSYNILVVSYRINKFIFSSDVDQLIKNKKFK
jgi:hypothetical protein